VTVALVSRMLWTKGIREYVNAAKSLRTSGLNARFLLIGEPDPENPATVDEAQLRKWHAEGAIEYLGRRSDVVSLLDGVDIMCLPSYREGLPKSLLEGAAAGLPLVSADVPGCREAVVHGRNGFLVPAENSVDLAHALRTLIEDPELRRRFGEESRALAVSEFSIEGVVASTMRAYEDVVSCVGS